MALANAVITLAFLDTILGGQTIINLRNILLALMVAGITGGFSFALLVPLIVSAAGAIGSGLNYYIYFADFPILNMAIAAPFADVAWLIGEAGLNFYSYAILINILRGSERIFFMALFWSMLFIIASIRATILVFRVLWILDNDTSLVIGLTIGYLHIGLFATIALVECVSAGFLLKIFRLRLQAPTFSARLLRYLARSTEIRLATLAPIGIMRSITFPLHFLEPEAKVARQLDNFAITMLCVFPIVLLP
ncbi:hypothetical protein VFPPC_09245 [Pochonia chlamydosporia 170]|uniref:Uncharacterized protein n=1 Tax=Pochonia chlamydosporia 170 TaxID=1380566 RepID=A0A179F7J3_METCM|nr:hypothetical protein VFPPC_09245 [Pochonia chlamydosporia 170]OAQ61398.2 hypothetical protein VFPPC_09245 [Pochonia chlamydosporia 170]